MVPAFVAVGVFALVGLGRATQAAPAVPPPSGSAASSPSAKIAPLPSWVKSARVRSVELPIVAQPWAGAPRRGTAIRGVLLPVGEARLGAGCAGRFLSVGSSAWVCEDSMELSGNPAVDPSARALGPSHDGLPFRYAFVRSDGSFGYDKLANADIGAPVTQLDPGFAVAVVEERAAGGERYGRTRHGYWVPMRDLSPVQGTSFEGVELRAPATAIPYAWVIATHASVHSEPREGSAVARRLDRLDRVDVVAQDEPTPSWVRVGERAWVRAKDVRQPVITAPPAEIDVSARERWIDVDLARQTLVAYEGASAVFATMVSTGLGKGKQYNATPTGVHRIWVKLLSSDMDNLEDDSASRYYRIEDVPWVQYFSNGVGLHGAFWHRSFGARRSHGCVNLAPLDAERLFYWTQPPLPAGWSAVHPTASERGTVVLVR